MTLRLPKCFPQYRGHGYESGENDFLYVVSYSSLVRRSDTYYLTV